VTKWETYGVNYQKRLPNPQYNAELANEIKSKRAQVSTRNGQVVFGSIVIAIFSVLILSSLAQ
jgi:hypothetical protein